jgi:hypothetical protein
MAWERQGNGMGTAWERHGMCESALTVLRDGPVMEEAVSSHKYFLISSGLTWQIHWTLFRLLLQLRNGNVRTTVSVAAVTTSTPSNIPRLEFKRVDKKYSKVMK